MNPSGQKYNLWIRFSIVSLSLVMGCRLWLIQAQQGKEHSPIRSLMFNEVERTYRIYVPPARSENCLWPLVLLLHGGWGSSGQMEQLTCEGFNRLAERDGFVVVYPDGVDRHWNDGRNVQRYRAHREKADDVGFLRALIGQLSKEMPIDLQRVYAVGMSNGGMMCHRLAIEASATFAAIATVTGTMPQELAAGNPPTCPISILIMHGTEDPLVPWAGGTVHFRRQTFGQALSVEDTVQYWVKHNQCSSAAEVTEEPDRDPQDGTRVRRQVYVQGRENTEVVLYAIEGGGHTWPGGYPYLPERIIGKTSREIDANEVIWNFFRKHARR